MGGDVSALARLEAGGASHRDGAGHDDAITALRANGSGLFRLRLFVAPDGGDVVVNDLAYTVALARRVRAAGATLLLDLHYSDTWADPAHQRTPSSWASLDLDALEARVESYTAAVLDTLRAADVLPRLVQVGNEIDAGFLWPLGRVGGPGFDGNDARQRFGRLLRAGVRGVRRATTPADSVRIVLHHSQGADAGRVRWFFDLVTDEGVDFDVIGLSYYPWWHGPIAALRTTLQATAARYGRPVMVVETAYPWRDWHPLAGASAEHMAWPLTADGQRRFLRDVLAAVAAVPERRGIGAIWWYPESVRVPGLDVWGDGALALFDGTGLLLPAAIEFHRATMPVAALSAPAAVR